MCNNEALQAETMSSSFSRSSLLLSVSVGVGSGIAMGVARLLFQLNLFYILVFGK